MNLQIDARPLYALFVRPSKVCDISVNITSWVERKWC